MADNKFMSWIKNISNPTTVISDTITKTADSVADIVDRFVTNPEEKEAVRAAIVAEKQAAMKIALEKDRDLYADRHSARQMASVHGKLQTKFAMSFLIGFWVLLMVDIIIIAMFAFMGDRVKVEQWVQLLISNMITGVIAYLVSIVKEITGFLFGGSAGSDQAGAAMVETLKNNSETEK